MNLIEFRLDPQANQDPQAKKATNLEKKRSYNVHINENEFIGKPGEQGPQGPQGNFTFFSFFQLRCFEYAKI